MYAQSTLIKSANRNVLAAKVAKMNKRIARVFPGFAAIELTTPNVPHVLTPNGYDKETGKPVYVENEWVTVVGNSPVMPGWEFVAAYNFERDADGGTVCFCDAMPGKVVGPAHREISHTLCEHCDTARPRKQSFLVENTETGERKVVGRSCLKDFTGHTQPEAFVNAATWLKELSTGEFYEYDPRGSIEEKAYDAQEILEVAAVTVRKYGWLSGAKAADEGGWATSGRIRFFLGRRPTGNSRWDLEQKKEWDELQKELVAEDEDKAAAANALVELAAAEDSDYIAKLLIIKNARIVSERNIATWVSAIVLHLKTVWAKEREDRKQADKVNSSPVIEGRHVVDGVVISTKTVVGDYGPQYKMLVLDDRGFKVFGTIPSSIDVTKGDRVSFTAKCQASKDDECFGFYSRPTKASCVNANAPANVL